MIRIDEIWLSTQPMDMRAGMDTAMAQIMKAFGSIKPHCAYLFCNKRGNSDTKERIALIQRFIAIFGKDRIVNVFADVVPLIYTMYNRQGLPFPQAQSF